MAKKSGGELALFVVGASVTVLIFIVLYFRERKRKLAVMKTSNNL
jgi:multisubunit Na+/H+ antiporter MnhB subunit